MRASRIGLGATVICLMLLSLTAAAGGASAVAPAALPQSTIHGVDFQIRTQADTNFCLEAAPGTTPGRTVTLQQCGSPSAQRFAMSAEADGLNEMLDSQGMCLDVATVERGDGNPVPVTLCDHSKAQKLSYTGTGLLQFRKGCLQVAGAAANAPLTLAKCDVTKTIQRWLVTH